MSKVLCAVFLFSFPQFCIPQAATSAGVPGDVLPDAPRAQLASLLPQTSGLAVRPNVDLISPNTDGVALAPLEGTHVRLRLMTQVSSKSPNGSLFQARTEQSVVSRGAVVLPENTVFEGHLATKAAGRVMKSGSLFMTFDRLILPNGSVEGVNVHLVSAESTTVKSDSEGRLHPTLSKKRLAIQIGGTALTAKFADDLAELAGGAAVGAGTARAIGAGAAATFWVLQKGREVKLQPGDSLEVEFGHSRHSLQNNSALMAPNH